MSPRTAIATDMTYDRRLKLAVIENEEYSISPDLLEGRLDLDEEVDR